MLSADVKTNIPRATGGREGGKGGNYVLTRGGDEVLTGVLVSSLSLCFCSLNGHFGSYMFSASSCLN